jgi:LmbE family N-acetylglucosaminyl deacetylase
MSELPDAWETPQNILVMLAHPDDPEFFCGATLARWAQAGHRVTYVLLTCGDKGRNDNNKEIAGHLLCALRHKEQTAAAQIIGAQEVHFLDWPDGYLLPTLDLRRDIVRQIRRFKPDILVTCDPETLYPKGSYRLNHPDHRYAGQAVLDAVFPAAGNELYFPELLDEDLQPHAPAEVWISLTNNPNTVLDVTETFDTKIHALREHASQVGNPDELEERLRKHWRTEDSTEENPRYEEHFHVIKWR